MTMNYCGKCGSANGTTARFCRQCGTELNSQVAFTSQSAPLNVEFSTKTAMKEKPKDVSPEIPETEPSNLEASAVAEGANPGRTEGVPPPPPAPPVSKSQTAAKPGKAENTVQDPAQDRKLISASLRRVRSQSGPLVREAIKPKKGRPREQVIQAGQGSQGPTEGSGGTKLPARSNVEKQSAPRQEATPGSQSGLQTRAQTMPQTATNPVTAVAQSAARRNSETALSTAAISGSSMAPSSASTALGS